MGVRPDNLPATRFLRATAEGALGDFLATQRRFPDAETFLLASHESLKNSQEENSPRRRLVLQRLINLDENWGRREAASAYRDQLAATNR